MYTQEITGKHRTAFVIAVDQSLSMTETGIRGYGRTVSKAEAVARAVNELVSELENRAVRGDTVRNYFDVAVIGYGNGGVEPLLDPCRWMVPVSELRLHEPPRCCYTVERRLRDGKTVVGEEAADGWISPRAEGCTPMFEAFWTIRNILREWCAEPCHAESFPPVVINITDGEASDCDPDELRAAACEIRRLGTRDGNVLMMNIHITVREDACALLFPTRGEAAAGDRYACLLAECSSTMPSVFNGLVAASRGDDVAPPYLAMGYNTSPKDLFALLNIGSRSVSAIG